MQPKIRLKIRHKSDVFDDPQTPVLFSRHIILAFSFRIWYYILVLCASEGSFALSRVRGILSYLTLYIINKLK